jgi:hypothetical protein
MHCGPLFDFTNPTIQNRSETELRPPGVLRHEGIVVCAAVATIDMTSWALTSSRRRLR